MLRDVAIIDENNVWVVGKIETDSTTYNVARWDGNEWELRKLPAVTYSGTISNGALTSVFSFDEDNIWFFSDAGSFVYWNGESWQSEWVPERDGGINSIWGSSSSNIYFVGDNGSIVHYNGTTFTKMNSGTDVDLQDVWGLDEEHVWAIGRNVTEGNAFLKLENSLWKSVDPKYEQEVRLGQYSVWTDNLDILYTAGSSGRWGYSVKDSTFFDMEDVGEWIAYKIRGNTRNDMFTSGAGGEVMHYNGSSWWLFPELQEVAGTSTRWLSVDVKQDYVVVCGWIYDSGQSLAIVARGYRY